MADKPKWKRFEELAHQIQQALAPNAEVTLNEFIEGIVSKEKRQIDISVRARIGQYKILIVLECKDYANPVDSPEVECFIQKMQDVKAHRGVIISANGFTKGALNVAKNSCIETYQLIDVQNADWRSIVKIPVLLVGMHLKNCSFHFSSTEIPSSCFQQAFKGPMVLSFLALDMDQKPITKLKYLVNRKWNTEVIPQKEGKHLVRLHECRYIEYQGERLRCTVDVTAEVRETRFFGGVRLEEIKGFKDVQQGHIITKGFTTEMYSPYDIETGKVSGWIELKPGQEPPFDPMMTEFYSDSKPESEEEEEKEEKEALQRRDAPSVS
jgi:hypothetical protein